MSCANEQPESNATYSEGVAFMYLAKYSLKKISHNSQKIISKTTLLKLFYWKFCGHFADHLPVSK